MDVTIQRGVEWRDDLRNVAPDLWPELIEEYRFFCKRNLPNDCRQLLRMVTEGEHVDWAGYATREEYLSAGLGLDPQAVDWALHGLQLAGAEAPLGFQQAQTIGQRAAALAAPDGVPLPMTYTDAGKLGGRGKKAKDNISGFSNTSATRIVAKLKRDAPEIAERLAAGEFRSARAAARAAGFKVDTPPLVIIRRAWKRMTPEERETFLREVT